VSVDAASKRQARYPVSDLKRSRVFLLGRPNSQIERAVHRPSDLWARRRHHGRRFRLIVSSSLIGILTSGCVSVLDGPGGERAFAERGTSSWLSSVAQERNSRTSSAEPSVMPQVPTSAALGAPPNAVPVSRPAPPSRVAGIVQTLTRWNAHFPITGKGPPSHTGPAQTPQMLRATPPTVHGGQPLSATQAVDAGLPHFSPSSFFYADLRGAPLSPDSPSLVSHLAQSVTNRYNGVAALNVSDYNVGFYTAARGTSRTTVRFNDCQNKGWFDPQLARAFADVPIPSGAVAAAGTDHNLSIYDPTSDTLWEFWLAQRDASGWTACFGGRLDSVSTSPGYFPGGLGASATGISMVGGMVSLADMKRGYINHALYLAVPDVRKWTDYSWPAQRSDGSSDDPSSLLEGSRLRLDAGVNVDSLPLTPLGRMVAKAAQTYGFVVSDRAGAVAVITESGAATAASTGVDPWVSLLDLNSKPSCTQLAGFPWDRMQVVAKDWGKP